MQRYWCNCVLVDGICLSVGVFLNDFKHEFGSTTSQTAWVMSVLNGSYLFVGPIVSCIADKYGCRKVTIFGAIFCSIAIFCSAFSTSIVWLIVTFGVLGGIGLGFMYLPAIVMVGYYFDKRRALATGVAVCGSGIGTFLFAPVSNYLLQLFGWRGAMWITSSLVLHGVIFGAFYRPLRPAQTPQVMSDGITVDEITEMRSDHNNMLNRLKSEDNPVRNSSRRHRSLDITGTGTSFLPHVRINTYNDKQSKIARLAKSQDVIPTEVLMRWSPKTVTPFYRKDVLYTGSVLHLAQKMRSPSMNEFISSMVDVPGHSFDGDEAKRSLWGKTCLSAKKYIDFSLFLRPTFVLYCLSCVLHMLGFFVPFSYLPSLGDHLGFSGRQSSLLISIIGISNTIFRVAVGWVSDQKWANCLMINYISLLLAGTVTVLVPYCLSYELLSAYCFVYGMCIAAFISLRSIIMVELLGIERLTNAFGLVIMSQGISSFFGSPIAGLLSDWYGSYNATFYMGGATLIAAGLLCIPLRSVSNWELARELKKESDKKDNAEMQRMI
ncbi:Monocarboxylate transporter 14,Monocarboxylate transporter 12 [Acanthosepion pharaonis]|uniref:Monocarboxylate transporter 14,Monocarboxylate transporter 12 n=1 Tax=Acanthosepion pharaonis TaxID=158019 RepID=A0A812BJQ5_ACAPH|nr:Monocarboxylate transporter 14,Monocarboxylate transporter 12 [Sepia pharaonis]